MNRILFKQIALCGTLAAGLVLGQPAVAQSAGPSYGGAAIGSTDYGTGLKLFLGGRYTPVFGWEAQLTSFGSETYGAGYKQSAWALGGSAVARFPLASSVNGFGKVGLHYLMPRRTGPGGDPDSSLELGLGIGVQFQFSHSGGLRLEFENIGGPDGDFASIGLHFTF